MTPLTYERDIRASLLRFTDDIAIRLGDDVEAWIGDNCTDRPILRFHDNQFKISFDDKADMMLFNITFP